MPMVYSTHLLNFTPSGTAHADYPLVNLKNYDFPNLPARSTSTSTTTWTFDLGSSINISGILIGNVNFTSIQLTTSTDGTTYTQYGSSGTLTISKDVADDYYKLCVYQSRTVRYFRQVIPTQSTTDGLSVFSQGFLCIFSSAVELPINPTDMTYSLVHPTVSFRSEIRRVGFSYLNITLNGMWQDSQKSSVAPLTNSPSRFVFFINNGKSEEGYLCRVVQPPQFRIAGEPPNLWSVSMQFQELA